MWFELYNWRNEYIFLYESLKIKRALIKENTIYIKRTVKNPR